VEEPLQLRPWDGLSARECAEFYMRNREHLRRWEPVHDERFFTEPEQQLLQERLARGRQEDRQYAYAVLEQGRLAGRVAISDVIRGAFQSAHLGYLTDVDHCGRGVATSAVRLLLRIAFGDLRLHRLQAAVMPSNQASLKVVRRTGFHEIGLSPAYLHIAGRWEDHLLFAVTAAEPAHP
jgi:[ribosomal protein S5]-alanine N-acetyltransferase